VAINLTLKDPKIKSPRISNSNIWPRKCHHRSRKKRHRSNRFNGLTRSISEKKKKSEGNRNAKEKLVKEVIPYIPMVVFKA